MVFSLKLMVFAAMKVGSGCCPERSAAAGGQPQALLAPARLGK